ncbi:MAG: electron transfer flavoprotein subunit beta/FixA family protein [Erysipelotrichaceae bacterium]|jgi:electron transfer flavoprotein beta subunit|nr:electron transfer flavoprotein subunit beta/FixA family protein [Erysipelotrichaceae bacterium]
MNIIVCIKQVPGTSNVNIDPKTGTLIRDGAAAKMNPYDLFALEMGLKLREEYGGSLRVVSMGPNSALQVIREAVYMGADGGVLISDRKFGGADVLATSYTLCSGIKALGDYDLILTGKQTTDGDTAQVGSELAEHLGIPHVAYVRSLKVKDDRLEYVSNLDEMVVHGLIEMPCLVCADGEINTPRLPSFKRKVEFEDCSELIRVITFDDVEDKDENHYGLKGSPTQVEKIFEPDKNKDKQMISDGDLALETFKILKSRKFI